MLHSPYMTQCVVPASMTQRVWREDCSGCSSSGGNAMLTDSLAVAWRWKNPLPPHPHCPDRPAGRDTKESP